MTSVHAALDHRIFKKECRSLARAGFDVTVVGPHPKDEIEEQVRIKSVIKHKSPLLRMTRTVWNVFWEARKRDADIYHFHDPELIPAGLLLRSLGKTVIYDIHEDFPKDVLFKSYLPHWSRRFIAWMADKIEPAACKRFSAIVSVTPSIAERIRAANQNTVVIYNYPYPEELISENPLSWKSRSLAATYVGTITKQRGIAEMVHAMAALPASLDATLEIAGDYIPEEIRKLQGWSRVNFHGGLDQRSTYQLLRNARVGLVCEHPIATFLESVPVKIFEYMGAGLPIIASDFPFWRRMLDGVGCVLYVDPFNVEQIAAAIEYLLTHPAEAEEMGKRGQTAVASRFNWNVQAGKLVNLYKELLDGTCVG
jgi:glycosyltransferase involved in cell wall biosynthesis